MYGMKIGAHSNPTVKYIFAFVAISILTFIPIAYNIFYTFGSKLRPPAFSPDPLTTNQANYTVCSINSENSIGVILIAILLYLKLEVLKGMWAIEKEKSWLLFKFCNRFLVAEAIS